MLIAKWSVCLILASGLLQSLPLVSPEPAAAAVETNSRKYISFVQRQDSPLNNMLLQSMRLELPRSEYALVPGITSGILTTYIQEMQDYQKNHALEAHQETEILQLGDRSLSWGDFKRIINSSAVLATDWSYSPIELTGPHQIGTSGAESWVFRVESDLKINLEVYDLTGATPVLATTLQNVWRAKKDIPIRDLLQLQSLVKDVTKIDVDIHNPLHQIMILDVIKKLPSFQQLIQENPSEYLASEGLQAVAASGFGPLLTALKTQAAIQPKGGIQTADMQNGIKVSLQPAESNQFQSPRMDQGYKILDSQGGEVGFGKVRQWDTESFTLQPILAKRDFLVGDQVQAMPRLGLNVVLRGGTAPLWADYQPTSIAAFFNPNTELELQYDLGPLLGWSEFYATLGGGATFVIPSYPGLAAPTGINGEIGLLKRWYLRQWLIDGGISGGILFGLMNSPQTYEPLSSIGFSTTARFGISYQFTPDFILGLHAGFRFASGGPWMSAYTGPNYTASPLSGWGPLLQLNASYTF